MKVVRRTKTAEIPQRWIPVNSILNFIIQHIDTLPKYGQKVIDIRYVYMTYIQRWR